MIIALFLQQQKKPIRASQSDCSIRVFRIEIIFIRETLETFSVETLNLSGSATAKFLHLEMLRWILAAKAYSLPEHLF